MWRCLLTTHHQNENKDQMKYAIVYSCMHLSPAEVRHFHYIDPINLQTFNFMRLYGAILLMAILACQNQKNSPITDQGLLEYIIPSSYQDSTISALSASVPFGAVAVGPRRVQIQSNNLNVIGHLKGNYYGSKMRDLKIAPLFLSANYQENQDPEAIMRNLMTSNPTVMVDSKPGSCTLRYGAELEVELSAASSAAFHQYTLDEEGYLAMVIGTFDQHGSTHLQVEENPLQFNLQVDADQCFSLQFSQPSVKRDQLMIDSILCDILVFEMDENPLQLKVGYAHTVEAAALTADTLGSSMTEVRNAAILAWQDVINSIEVNTPSQELLNEFYTALYYCYHFPVRNPQRSRTAGHHFKKFPPDFEESLFSLFTILSPELISDMVASYLAADSLTESHVSAFTEAYLKGFREEGSQMYDRISEVNLTGELVTDAHLYWCLSQIALLQNDLTRYAEYVEALGSLEDQFLSGDDRPVFVPFDMRLVVTSFETTGLYDTLLTEFIDTKSGDVLNHLPYLFNHSGSAWKTQEKVIEVLNAGLHSQRLHESQVAAWTVFTHLGFYPVHPPEGVYVIGVPSFTRAEIHFDTGTSFILRGRFRIPENFYVQVGTLQEEPLTRSYVRQYEIVEGGEMILEMGPVPNYLHWSDLEAAPPSLSDPDIE